MRVLLCVDMEGISQITSFQQLWAEYPEYWESGKEATTAETLAAVQGLFAGGATGVTIVELHGAPCEAIIDLERLPEQIEWVGADAFLRNGSLAAEHDALFQLGWHARCGTPNGFMSHTNGMNMRVAVDGRPVTEIHVNAWRTELPVIGVTGDEVLGAQLDGGLDGTPFLAVKRASDRASAEPLFSAEESAAAIEAFVTWCCTHAAEREPLAIPERFVLSLSMPSRLADQVDGEHGLRRTSPAVLAKSATDWWWDAEPAVASAMHASLAPLVAPGVGPAQRKELLEDWAHAREPEWLT